MRHFYIMAAAAIGCAASAYAAPIDIGQLPDKTWNPRETYTVGTDADTWNLANYGSSGIDFAMKEGSAFAPSGYESVFNVSSPSSAELDAWLASPALQLKKGNTYQISFSYRYTSSSTRIAMACWMDGEKGTSGEAIADAMAKKTANVKNDGYPTAWTETSFEYTATEDMEGYLNFQAYTSQYATSSGLLYVGKFEVKVIAGDAQPAAPTAFSVTPAADGAVSAALSWTLPTENLGGQPLTGALAIQNVLVYRDGELAATLPGSATSWTDTEATGLTKGDHTYQIAATAAGETGVRSQEVTVYVGPYLYAPLTMTFSDSEWTSYKIAGQAFTSNSSYVPSPYTNAASIWSYSETMENAWLCSPGLALDPDKTYTIRFRYFSWDDPESLVANLNVYAAGKRVADDASASEVMATTPIYTLTDIKRTEPMYNEVEIKGVKGQGDPTHILFRVNGKFCKRFSIYGFEVEEFIETPFVPAAPTALEAVAAPYQQLEVALSWTLPSTAVGGEAFADSQTVEAVRVYRDGEVVYTAEEAVSKFTDTAATGLTAGDHSYAVSAQVAGAWSPLSAAVEVKNVGPAPICDIPWEPVVKQLSAEEFSLAWVNYPAVEKAYWSASYYGLRYINSLNETHQAWLVSAPLNLDNKSYTLTVTTSGSSENVPTLSVGLVDTTMPSEFLLTIEPDLAIGEETSLNFSIPSGVAASGLRLAFRASADGSTNAATITELLLDEDFNTGIADITAETVETAVYDLSGRRISHPEKGIYILRSVRADGSVTSRKIVLK